MVKPFDVSKLRKDLTKAIPNMSVGYNDPKVWISTGNYALNYRISGHFDRGVPLGKVTVFAGESGCLPETATVKIKTDVEKTVTIKELRDLYHSSEYDIEIDTPDGYQPIGQWFDKGVLDMVTIKTANHETTCAVNHLIQRHDGEWRIAAELAEGDNIMTATGIETIISNSPAVSAACYDFEVKHPNHRYYGDGIASHNSGKSLISASIIRHAQDQGIYVILIDTENALDSDWLHALNVSTDEDKLLKLNMAMIDDVAKTISEFMKSYKDSYSAEDAPQVLFVIDSLGMLLTPTDIDQFNKGDLKGDMGRKPKALTALVRNCVNMFGQYNVGLVATNHSYASQDLFNPDDKISGGSGFIYASSIVVASRKLKLKEDEDGNKITDVRGIRSMCKIMKSRFAKPFETVELKIPYNGGLDKYSGLFDMFEKSGLLTKDGNKFKATLADGTELKEFRKNWTPELLDKLIVEFQIREAERIKNGPEVMPDYDEDEINDSGA